MSHPSLDAVLANIDANLGGSLERLKELVRIKSISTDPAYAEECKRAAEWLANDLRNEGFEASARPTAGHPMVVGHDQTGSGAPIIVEEEHEPETPYCAPFGTSPWAGGRKVAGSNNWVKSGSTFVPTEWSGTRSGADPLLEDVAARRLRPVAGSTLVDAGNPQPATPSNFPFPSPLLLPAFDPPQHAKPPLNGRQARHVVGARIDIGALEQAGSSGAPIPRNGSRPLLPPRPTGNAGLAGADIATPATPGQVGSATTASPAPVPDNSPRAGGRWRVPAWLWAPRGWMLPGWTWGLPPPFGTLSALWGAIATVFAA